MSNLNERDLAVLSTIIYSDYFLQQRGTPQLSVVVNKLLDLPANDGPHWDNIIKGFSGDFDHIVKNHPNGIAAGRQEAINRFRAVLEQAKASPNLMNLQIRYPILRSQNGYSITAATFVTPGTTTATVVFRGTDGSYEQWFDNVDGLGTGRGTPAQNDALRYMEQYLHGKYTDVSVTGHSKGGNLAMFVTLFSPIVTRCLNFDGQGFSDSFRRQFSVEIEANRHKIKTIAAHVDFVVGILGINSSIAGERIFVNNDAGVFSAEAHYMSNLIFHNDFDEHGNFASIREQHPLMQMFEVGLGSLMFLLPDHMEDWFVNMFGPLAALALGNIESLEDVWHALTTILEGFMQFAADPMMLPYLMTAILVSFAVAIFYGLGMLVEWTVEQFINAVFAFVDAVAEIAKRVGEWMVNFVNNIREAINNFAQWVRNFRDRAGINYAANNPHIRLNTANLRGYANRINSANNRINSLDGSLRRLYWQVGFLDLWDIMVANLMTRESHTLNQVRNYLNNAADRFDTAENRARGHIGG
jgi:uncharacterized protein YukE/flagellar biosynthesis protein FliQ